MRQCKPDLTVSEGYKDDQRLATTNQGSQGLALPSPSRTQGRFQSPKSLTVQSPEAKVCEPSRPQQGLEGQSIFDEPPHGGGD